jgi:4-hydroxy-4-methyl-2-oxoglutarate aldolase
MTDDDLSAWRALSTATVSDALDRLGIAGQALGIAPLDRGFRATGRAFTVKYAPAGTRAGTVGDYIDEVPPGAIVVLDNGGRLDATVWGDILTTMAHRRGIAGTVINGVCRDVARSLELRYPLFTRGACMRTGKDRVQAESFGTPVSLGEIRVEAGDLLVCDADGVVAVPAAREADVLARALEIERAEHAIRAAIEGGERLDAARRNAGYFGLQRRDDADDR